MRVLSVQRDTGSVYSWSLTGSIQIGAHGKDLLKGANGETFNRLTWTRI
jgi:hypothetical protein